ncbi:hypothetical protein [Methylobacterium brachiatum]|uniref:hypothetical protein n=1 Tax=Methylobacterium brachiatum TaxID=269660 RepID=UPI0008EA544F|nr:hypothetical protein [Methylobacterium brachiatum]SFI05258.1 hypothetical protein SAMN02799642_00548 [Methylobacterium brachiatum]
MIDPDDIPRYLHDAYGAAFDHGLQSLNLTRIGGGENRMWQASSRFPRSSGYHVEIEADPYDAIMKALGAWTRVEARSSATHAPGKPGSDFADNGRDHPSEPDREDFFADLPDPATVHRSLEALGAVMGTKSGPEPAAAASLFD